MQEQILISRTESIGEIKLIPYDHKKEEETELLELELLEKDMLILNEIMKEFGCVVELQGENLNKIDNDIKNVIETVETANEEIKEAVGIKTEIISTKLTIATIIAIGINTPVGLMLGTKILAGTLIASGAATIAWMYKT